MALRQVDIRFRFVLMLALLISFSRALAQVVLEDSSLLNRPISQIEIVGNQITRPEVILREMRIKPGSPAQLKRIEADQLNIYDLDLFNRVELRLIPRGEATILVIDVTEKWYIFPEPFWYYKNNDTDKPLYGLRFWHYNFRGENEKLMFRFWGGADHGFEITHKTPWMRGTPELSRMLNVSQVTQNSQPQDLRGLELEERHTRGWLTLGKRWTLDFSSDIGIRFRVMKAVSPLQTASHTRLDRILEETISSTWDTRDWHTFPHRGLFIQAIYFHGWVMNNSATYHRLSLDLRQFLPYRLLTLATHAQWFPSWNVLPQYDRIYVYDTTPIRSTCLSDEGDSFYMLTFETRFDLLKQRYYTWRGAPFCKKYFKNLPYALAAEIFIEAGDVYSAPGDVVFSELKWGYGFGLMPKLPYLEVIRLEASFNPAVSPNNMRFSIKTGISF